MQLHELKTIHKAKKSRRIGRGGKRGFTSGKGSKGQASRAGRKFKPIIKEIIKRYPKLRGYKFNPIGSKPAVLNVEILEKKFQSKETVSPKSLIEKRIIRKMKGKAPAVKILGNGDIKKALVIENCLVSKEAKAKIEKAGGEVK